MNRRDRIPGRRLEPQASDAPERVEEEEPDWALAQRGDQEAFERLYRANAARIHSLVRRMAGSRAADDLTQEVFIRAWEKLGTFRGDASFSTWLHRLAVNHILSARERRKKRDARHVSGEGVFGAMESRGDRPGLRVDFEGAVEELPDGARRVFVLYDVEGYTHREIAGMMEISEGTSKSQLHRARMLLREYLG